MQIYTQQSPFHTSSAMGMTFEHAERLQNVFSVNSLVNKGFCGFTVRVQQPKGYGEIAT